MNILNHFNTSVEKALTEIDPNWRDYPGLIVCGTHTPENYEVILEELEHARKSNVPTLGICFGMQMMAVEHVRNVGGQKDAISEEFPATPGAPLVVIKMPELRVGLHPGANLNDIAPENFWHNFKVNIDGFPELWDGFIVREINDVVTYMALKDHTHYIGVQYHPEYASSIDQPHPLLVNFLNVCRSQKSGTVE